MGTRGFSHGSMRASLEIVPPHGLQARRTCLMGWCSAPAIHQHPRIPTRVITDRSSIGCVTRPRSSSDEAPVRVTARERLLDAAESLMWERGYEAVGVAELCAVACAPRGSFYHWWPSKQELALAMLERSWERVKATVIMPAFTGPGPLAARVDRYAELLVSALSTQFATRGCVPGCRFGNFAIELSTREPTLRAALDRTFGEMCALFATAIAEARVSGEVPANLDPVDAAEALCAHMEGLMVLAKARQDPTVLSRLGPDARRLFGILPVTGRVAGQGGRMGSAAVRMAGAGSAGASSKNQPVNTSRNDVRSMS